MAMHHEPEIQLVDEVLAVENTVFQKKCLREICSKGFYGYS